MVSSELKKNLLFSCVENKELIDAMVGDESKSMRKKPSAILELRLFDSFLTQNEQIRFWILNLYQGKSSGDTLSSVFNYNAAGVKWKSLGLPLLPLIEFAIDEQKFIDKDEFDKDSITSNLIDYLIQLKNNFMENSNDERDSDVKYKKCLEALEFFIDVLKKGDQKIPFVMIYRFFKDYWDILKDSAYSFKVLSDLASMQKGWRNDNYSRFGLACCLRDLDGYLLE